MFAGDVHGAREMQGLISCHEEEIENLKVNIQTKRNRWNKFRLLFQIIIVFSGCSSQFLFIRSALFCFYHSKLSYNRNNVLDLLRKSIKTICLYIIKIHLRSNRIDRRRNWKRYRGGGRRGRRRVERGTTSMSNDGKCSWVNLSECFKFHVVD